MKVCLCVILVVACAVVVSTTVFFPHSPWQFLFGAVSQSSVGQAIDSSSDQSLAILIQTCYLNMGEGNSIRCLRKSMPAFIDQYGTTAVMEALARIDKDKKREGFDCHGVSHLVGEASAAAHGLGTALRACTRECGFGCFHGAAFGGLSHNPGLLNDLDSVCRQFSASAFPGQELTACQHSLGHGLAELAGRDPQKSLLLCDKLSNGSAREACGTGVLMELIEGPILDHGVTLVELPDDIPAFCRTLPEDYADTCLINVGSYEYKRSGSVERSFKRCRDIPLRLQRNCAEDLGTDFHFIFAGEAGNIFRACSGGDSGQQSACVEGALGSGLVTDPSGVPGVALCQAVALPLQKSCFLSLSKSINQLHGNEKWSSFCGTLNSPEREWCRDIK